MPLEDSTRDNLIKILGIIAGKFAASASKLANAAVNVDITQHGESFVQDNKVVVEAPSALVIGSLAGSETVLVLQAQNNAALVASKMAGAEPAEALDDNLSQALVSLFTQAFEEVCKEVKELQSSQVAFDKFDLQLVDPGNEDSQKLSIELSGERNLFEFAVQVDDQSFPVIIDMSLDLLEKINNTFLESVSAAENPGAETVGDFMGTNFAEITDGHNPDEVDEDKNLNLLMDIRLGLIAELGRAEMHLKDILKLTKGSIIELDRLSGEPVDLFVNNKLIARGEVVVIDDSFGLRITQLAGSKAARGNQLGLMGSSDYVVS